MKKLFKLIALVAVAIGLHASWIYQHLDVGELPVVADVIIVPEGGPERAPTAGALYKQGYSRSGQVIVSPLAGPGFDFTWYYELAGVPNSAIIQENQATSTWTNALYTLDLMATYGYDSALIVTTDYHSRRTRMIYERVNHNYGFDLTYVSAYPVVDDEIQPYQENTSNRALAQEEIYKYYGYLFGLYHWIDL